VEQDRHAAGLQSPRHREHVVPAEIDVEHRAVDFGGGLDQRFGRRERERRA